MLLLAVREGSCSTIYPTCGMPLDISFLDDFHHRVSPAKPVERIVYFDHLHDFPCISTVSMLLDTPAFLVVIYSEE